MVSVQVDNKQELKRAMERDAEEIVITGDLAAKISKSRRIGQLRGWKKKAFFACLGSVAVAIAAVPLSGGLATPVSGFAGYGAAATAATLSGLEIATIMTIGFLGTGLVLAICKDYDEVSYEDGKLTLRRKSKTP